MLQHASVVALIMQIQRDQRKRDREWQSHRPASHILDIYRFDVNEWFNSTDSHVPAQVHEVWCERDVHVLACCLCQPLLDLRHVPVLAHTARHISDAEHICHICATLVWHMQMFIVYKPSTYNNCEMCAARSGSQYNQGSRNQCSCNLTLLEKEHPRKPGKRHTAHDSSVGTQQAALLHDN